jgi:hypothetical protein
MPTETATDPNRPQEAPAKAELDQLAALLFDMFEQHKLKKAIDSKPLNG